MATVRGPIRGTRISVVLPRLLQALLVSKCIFRVAASIRGVTINATSKLKRNYYSGGALYIGYCPEPVRVCISQTKGNIRVYYEVLSCYSMRAVPNLYVALER